MFYSWFVMVHKSKYTKTHSIVHFKWVSCKDVNYLNKAVKKFFLPQVALRVQMSYREKAAAGNMYQKLGPWAPDFATFWGHPEC